MAADDPNRLITELIGDAEARRGSGQRLGGAALRADDFGASKPLDVGDRYSRLLLEEEALRAGDRRPLPRRQTRLSGLAAALAFLGIVVLAGIGWFVFEAHERDNAAARLRIVQAAQRREDEERVLRLGRKASAPPPAAAGAR